MLKWMPFCLVSWLTRGQSIYGDSIGCDEPRVALHAKKQTKIAISLFTLNVLKGGNTWLCLLSVQTVRPPVSCFCQKHALGNRQSMSLHPQECSIGAWFM